MSEPNKPIDTIPDGRLKANLWKNEGEHGPYLTVTFARTYTDKDGNPRDTQSFSENDLLKIAELARESYQVARHLKREFREDQEARTEVRDTEPQSYSEEAYADEAQREPVRERTRPRARSYAR